MTSSPRSQFVALATFASALFALSGCGSGDELSVGPASTAEATATSAASPEPVATPTRSASPQPVATPTRSAPPLNSPNQDPRNGPWNRDLALYRSSDGKTFSGPTTFVERAGVPCLIRDASGRLVAVFQWFPFENKAAFDRVATSFSTDGGATWSKPAQIEVSGFSETLMRPFDPTIVQLGDGRYRLYFTSNERAGQGKPAIYSAIGSDAVHFAFEAGARFAPEGGTVDASIVAYQGTWHLFSHNQQANTGAGFHAVSTDGLSFQQVAMVDVGRGKQWIGNAVGAGGQLRYFGSGEGGVWSAVSNDGVAWTVEPGIRVGDGGDPSAVVLPGGELLLAVVGAIRTDAGPAPP